MSEREPLSPEAEIRRMSRRSFAWGAVATAAGYGIWKWIDSQGPSPKTGFSTSIPGPLRKVLDANGALASGLASNQNLSEDYPRSAAGPPRTNGHVGLQSAVDLESYKVSLEGLGELKTIRLSDLTSLPKTEVVTKFKCVEGWSVIVQAAGVRFSDFLKAVHGTIEDLPPFAFLTTPDEEYYVGLDVKSLLHPQTLLAWEMDGKPLKPENGAPIRLFVPTKYGIKNLKRVGTVRFQTERPTDYWFERGYDWYAGL